MFKNLGTVEIIVIAVVLLVLFGGKKLPELARGIGQAGKELKDAKKEIQKDAIFTYLVSEIGESRDIYRFDIEQDDLNESVKLFKGYILYINRGD